MTSSSNSSNEAIIDFQAISDLVANYKELKSSGEIKRYNEEMTKKDFILPLFEALGWNVYNKTRKHDRITAEETISKKRVDYGFWLNETPKFYLEAKSLKESDIIFGRGYDKQAINYSWLRSCSWAVLTNFETLAVYNAERPEGDWFFTLKADEYLGSGKEQLRLLSKTGFESNELDQMATKYGKRIQRRPVDKQLLSDLIRFREILSKDIMKNNSIRNLSQDYLDESVQRILDRLIFIRNTEDRGLESNELQSNFRQWSVQERGNLIKRIQEVYRRYDNSYNSKIFSEHLCDSLEVSNEAFREVIQGLYSPEGTYSYDFSVIASDTLGSIYEQYLENILKTTPKRAKLEKSKVHRKEQGIYYTPSFIVDYIVKNTLGEYIKTHTSEEIKNVKILDPACGSGSFLIRAYQELENYWKENSDFAQLSLDSDEFYSKRVEILKNNIFGVDLDPKAVEIAQLNLLLQISESKQRLPILQNNIRVGNSLIDDPNVSNRAFVWDEVFSEIMKKGGFDLVMGNPPYVRIQNLNEKESEFFSNHFESATKNYDIYVLFVEKSLKLLNRNGMIGFIIPSKFVNADYGIGLRDVISKRKSLRAVVDFKDIQIFGTATNYTCLLFLNNSDNERFVYQYPRDRNSFSLSQLSDRDSLKKFELEIPTTGNTWVLSDSNSSSLIKKLSAIETKLGGLCKNIFQGLVTGADSIYFVRIVSDFGETVRVKNIKDGNEFDLERSILKKLLKGKDIRKWSVVWEGYYVLYPYKVETGKAGLIPISEIETEYPLTYKYLKNYESKLRSREEDRFEKETNWHQFGRLQNIEKFEQTKIMTQVLASHNTFAYDGNDEYYFVGGGNAGGYGIVLRDEYKDLYHYLLALLNSKVLEFYLKNTSTPFRGGYFSYGKRFIERLPIPLPDNSSPTEITQLSKKLLEQNETIASRGNKLTDEADRTLTEIEYSTKQLNNLIYALYELTEQEILVIEQFLNGD